jgi:hypothetical protein
MTIISIKRRSPQHHSLKISSGVKYLTNCLLRMNKQPCFGQTSGMCRARLKAPSAKASKGLELKTGDFSRNTVFNLCHSGSFGR